VVEVGVEEAGDEAEVVGDEVAVAGEVTKV